MNEFVLTITIVLTGSSPNSIEEKFATEAACESARVIVLKEAAIFSAMLRRQAALGKVVIGIPQVAAVCKNPISN